MERKADALSEDAKRLIVHFYRSSAGADPVADWLKSLSSEDRQRLGRDLRLIELGWPMGMPLCRPMGGGLWELRCGLSSKRSARILFCAAQGCMILLHGFIKKTQKTPQSNLELARSRQNEVEG